MEKRPAQRCCQHEPAYPGTETVVFSIRFPDWVSHLASGRCPIEGPHLWNECGEFR